MNTHFSNLFTLAQVLPIAQRSGYALGSFSARSAAMIAPVLDAAEQTQSPLIVQISEKEFEWYEITPAEFAEAFRDELQRRQTTVPVVLHLDHTRVLGLIWDAIAAGFTSVMIDASDKPLQENIALTTQVVEYAHARGVSVEAELGRIGTADFIETDEDVELYTDPEEALTFVQATNVDALAVSVGTAHGVYTVRQPKIDLERLTAIRARIQTPLVLHGGSGTPADMVMQAIQLPGGGVSKVNIATDLELAYLQALGLEKRITNAALYALPADQLQSARDAIQAVAVDKILNSLGSRGHAAEMLQALGAGETP